MIPACGRLLSYCPEIQGSALLVTLFCASHMPLHDNKMEKCKPNFHMLKDRQLSPTWRHW